MSCLLEVGDENEPLVMTLLYMTSLLKWTISRPTTQLNTVTYVADPHVEQLNASGVYMHVYSTEKLEIRVR